MMKSGLPPLTFLSVIGLQFAFTIRKDIPVIHAGSVLTWEDVCLGLVLALLSYTLEAK